MPSWFTDIITGGLSQSERRLVAHIVLWIIVLGYIAFGFGVAPGSGAGFALANDVENKISQAVAPISKRLDGMEQSLDSVKEEQRRARIEQIERNLFDTRKSQCAAISANNREAAQFYQRRLDQQQRAYRELTGTSYAMPTCAEVGE